MDGYDCYRKDDFVCVVVIAELTNIAAYYENKSHLFKLSNKNLEVVLLNSTNVKIHFHTPEGSSYQDRYFYFIFIFYFFTKSTFFVLPVSFFPLYNV